MSPRLALLLLVVVAAGCSSSRQERIQVRRDPTDIEREKKLQEALSPAEIDERFLEQQEARRVPPDVWRSNVHWELTRGRVQAVLAGVPRDPWSTAESDRKRVLVRTWSDLGRLPPPPEPEGTPPSAEEKPEGEEAPAEEAPAGEAPAEGGGE